MGGLRKELDICSEEEDVCGYGGHGGYGGFYLRNLWAWVG